MLDQDSDPHGRSNLKAHKEIKPFIKMKPVPRSEVPYTFRRVKRMSIEQNGEYNDISEGIRENVLVTITR